MSFLKSLKQNKSLLINILILTIILSVGQWFQSDLFFNRDDINQGQWWKILTGNFTHSNIPHLLLNLSGVWILALLFIDTLHSKTFIFSSIFLSLAVGLGIYFFTPELTGYYGFSGALYGLYFIAGVSAILKRDLFTGVSVTVLVFGKIVWDCFNGGNQTSAELIGIPIANDAHLYGLIGAIIITMLLILFWYLNKQKSTPP